MRTQRRRTAIHARIPRTAAGKHTDVAPYRRFAAVWTAFRALWWLCAAALVLLPVGYAWSKLSASVEVTNMASRAMSEYAEERWTPFGSLLDFLYKLGMKPGRAAWRPSGIDYGNTRVSAVARGEPVYLAWQQSWKELAAVPEGVNVLAPRWFIVEDSGGKAVVNDLGNLLKNKVSSFAPAQYIQAAHAGGAEVWAQVACLSQPDLAKQIVTDGACRSAFISKLAAWVSEYDLDGIDFDFEKMDPADAELFTALVRDVKLALPAGVRVSVCVTVPLKNPEGNWWQCYDREGLGRVADYVAVMAYDNPALEPIDAIDWVSGKVRMMLDMVPQEKILLGVPFFGVDFQFTAPAGQKLEDFSDFEESEGRYTITPGTVKKLLDAGDCMINNKTVTVDYWIDKGVWLESKGIMAYSFADTDGVLHLMYCDDERSLAAKGRLLSFERLGGAAVWKLELGNTALWSSLYGGMTASVPVSGE
jgi:spore germination protein YaaH